MPTTKLLKSILLFCLFIIIAAILLDFSWRTIGKEMPQADAYLISWIWSWDIHALSTNPLNLFDANIFAPFKNTLAFSETLLGTLIFAWPILLLTKNIALTYNLVVLLTFAISGLGMYRLTIYLTKNKTAALLAALIYTFVPFKLVQSIGHLHVTGMWLPFVFLYLHKFFKNNSWKNILLLTLFIILVFLTGFHYFIFLPIVIIIFGLAFLLTKKFILNGQNIKKILVCLSIILTFVIPISLPYIQAENTYNFVRPLEEIEGYSPDIIDYFISPVFYTYFCSQRTHIEMIVSPGIVVLL